MYTIGIDIGSTYIKSAVFDLESQSCGNHISIPFPSRLPQKHSECFEVPAYDILNIVQGIIDNTIKDNSIDYILFSTQMHGFIYEPENSCLSPVYVSWQDSTCTLPELEGNKSSLEAISCLLSEGELSSSGIGLKPSLGMCNLYARLNRKSSPIHSSGELFTLGSWLIYKLTGNNICHTTNAAPLGLADITHNCWNQSLVHTLGFQNIRLPEIAGSDFQVCGYYKGIAVLPDYGDQQVSILGAQPSSGDVLVNIATAGQISINTDCYNPGEYEIRPFFQSTYINTISNMPSGRNLAVLTGFFREVVECLTAVSLTDSQIYDSLHKLWQSGKGRSNGLIADTLFFPTDKRSSGGSISNIKADNFNPATLLCSFYENISEIYEKNIYTLLLGKIPQRLLFLGGVSHKNPDLVEAISSRLKTPYAMAPMTDESLNGMYRLSLMACGKINSITANTKMCLNP